MAIMLAITLWLYALGILGYIVYGSMWRGHSLITIRTLFLASYALFIPNSAAFSLWQGEWGWYPVSDPEGIGLIFTFWAAIFLLVFELVYWKATPVSAVVRKIPAATRDITDLRLMVMAVVLLAIAAVLPTRGDSSPNAGGILAALVYPVQSSFRACAAAIGAWLIVGRWRNPMYLAFGCFVFGTIAVDLLARSFSRRPILTVGLTLVWALYYRAFQGRGVRLPQKKLLFYIVPAVVVAVVGVAFVTGSRNASNRGVEEANLLDGRSATEKIGEGLNKLLYGQATGAAGMWAIEHWDQTRAETRYAMSLRYFFFYPVPRAIWSDKPIGLSYYVPFEVGHPGAGHGLTMPPGVVGYAAAEGGVLVLIIYAMWFGVFCKVYDEYARNNHYAITVILPIGCALGHIVGLPRGGLASFMFLYMQETMALLILFFVLSYGNRSRQVHPVAYHHA